MRIIYKWLEKGKRLGSVTLPWCQINLVDDNSCVHMMIPVSHSRMILGKLRVVWVLAHWSADKKEGHLRCFSSNRVFGTVVDVVLLEIVVVVPWFRWYGQIRVTHSTVVVGSRWSVWTNIALFVLSVVVFEVKVFVFAKHCLVFLDRGEILLLLILAEMWPRKRSSGYGLLVVGWRWLPRTRELRIHKRWDERTHKMKEWHTPRLGVTELIEEGLEWMMGRWGFVVVVTRFAN